MVLLKDLCRNLQDPERAANRRGPKPHHVRDMVFAMAFKVYCGLSSRRFSCDLAEAHEKGHTDRLVPGTKVPAFFENPEFTPILKTLIGISAAPLRSVETQFAVDSSGFGSEPIRAAGSTRNTASRKLRCKWVKTHIACGVKTNIVTAVRILDEFAADSPQFVPLVKETRRTFEVGEVSADKAYGSLANFEAVAECGGQGFIAFKVGRDLGAIGGDFEKGVPLLHISSRGIHAKLSPAIERRKHLLGDQTEVWRFRDEQDRRGHEQRSFVQDSVPQPDVSDSGARDAGHCPDFLER